MIGGKEGLVGVILRSMLSRIGLGGAGDWVAWCLVAGEGITQSAARGGGAVYAIASVSFYCCKKFDICYLEASLLIVQELQVFLTFYLFSLPFTPVGCFLIA